MQKYGREKFIVGEKIGVKRGTDGSWHGVHGTRDYLRQSVDIALQRLQTTYIDLVYFNRHDPNTPIEETVLHCQCQETMWRSMSY
jgi:aryl-alcohol dehydrogenase-like predicted oxidoreductase